MSAPAVLLRTSLLLSLLIAVLFPVRSQSPPLLAPSDSVTMESSLGIVRFFGEIGLYMIVRSTPKPGQPGTSVVVEVDHPTVPGIVPPGEIALPEGRGTLRFHDTLAVMPTGVGFKGDYLVRYRFEDADVEQTIPLPGLEPEIGTPVVRIETPSDMSLAIEWDVVDGAKAYWVVLYEHFFDETINDVNFRPLASGDSAGRLTMSLPANSLKPEQDYTVAVHPITIDPRAEGLEPFFYGNTGFNTFHTPQTTVPSETKGDLNRDGRVTVADATLSLQYAVGLRTPAPDQLSLADVNGDGKLTTADTILILQKAVGTLD